VYTYAADGTKLRTVHTISGTTTQKDYCANVVYENGAQKMLLTEEGYVDLSVTTPAYYYYLKDHQGNNRVVLSSGGTVQEVNHYYPFGGVFASSSNVQPYKYNGKELDTKKSLNWYDYGARHYDAALGRWFVVDPLAERMYGWSPYAYCFNNPIKFVDEDGEFPWPALIGSAIEYGLQVYQNYHAGKNGYDTWIGDVNIAKVGLSAFNPLGKFKIAKTLLLEGAKETIIFTLNDNAFKTESDVKKIMSNALLNTVVNVGAGKLMEGSDDALIKVNREMNKANQGVRKAKKRTNRQPNSEKNKVLFEKAQINAEQIRKKQVMIQMWNSNSNTLEQTITNGSLLIINNRNEEKTK
jgi:RHS repeat-associated protein